MDIDDVIEKSWQIYDDVRSEKFIVDPSIPILFFGDSEKYFRSKIRIVTVGLNPSKTEFPENNRFQRFPSARCIYPDILDGRHFNKYLSALNGYFTEKPYRRWFNSYEPILNGLGSSYYCFHESTSLHTDLCSPLATDPTWSNLTDCQKEKLETDGNILWQNLIHILLPDVILISVRSKYLDRIGKFGEWKVIYTVERKNPYEVKLSHMKVDDKVSLVVFGRAANLPFGTVSSKDKELIGLELGKYTHAQ